MAKKSEKDTTAQTEQAPRTAWTDPGAPRDLMDELRLAEESAYAVFRVKVEFVEQVLGPAPAALDATLARLEAAAKRKKIPPEVLERFKAEMVKRYSQSEKVRADMIASEGVDADDADPDVVKETDRKGLSVFALDWDGLYLESRAVKSMIRDVLSMQGVFERRKGDVGVGAKAHHNLGLFVEPYRLRFIDQDNAVITEPHGVRTYPAIIKGASGTHSALVSNEYLEQRPAMEFDVLLMVGGKVTKDILTRCLAACQRVGLGARRSQGFGQFKIIEFAYRGNVSKLINEDMLDDMLDDADETE